MGYYINPRDREKEQWLKENGIFDGIRFPNTSFDEAFKNKEMLVCLVNNGIFTAAGICIDAGELEAFNDATDSRPKFWYRVPFVKLLPYYPKVQELLI